MRRRLGLRRALWLGLLLAAAVGIGAAAPALAARQGSVDIEGTEIYEGPGKTYKVLDKLAKGTPIAASNVPTEGFFKVRTPTGLVGWVSADALVLQPPPAEGMTMPGGPPGGANQGSQAMGSQSETITQDNGFRERKTKKRLRLRALGGMDFFSVGDVNNLLQANVLQFGYEFGGEFSFILTGDLSMVVRLERVFKGVNGRDQSSSKVLDFELSSWPTMIGVELTLSSESKIQTHFAVMGGLGVQTDLNVTSLNDPAPNVTDMNAQAFTGFAKADLTYQYNKTFSFFAEAGYRYLKTIGIVPGQSVNGSGVFKNPSTNTFIPIQLDLSGPVVNAGVGVAF